MLLTQGTNYHSLTHLFSIIRGAGSEVGGREGAQHFGHRPLADNRVAWGWG